MVKRFLALILLSVSVDVWSAPFLAATWNTKHLGWGDVRDIERTAWVMRGFEFVALQEVHDPELVTKLVRLLEGETGEDWHSLVSGRAIGTRRYKEYYAFIWRESAIQYDTGAMVYLDKGSDFIREPFSAVFKTTDGDFRFLASNIHVIYGDKIADRRAEASLLDEYIGFLRTEMLGGTLGVPDLPILFFGDFNLEPDDEGFSGLRKVMQPVVRRGDSTLSKRDGRYTNLYDQIWITPNVRVSHAGVYDFPRVLGVSHKEARATISDHAPVYARVVGGK